MRHNNAIISRFNIVEGGNGYWWWIMDTERLTHSGDMLMCKNVS